MRDLTHILPRARVLENHILELVLHKGTLDSLLRLGVEFDSVLAVPHAIFPETVIVASVRIRHLAVALKLCIIEFSVVDGAVTPLHGSLAVDLILVELAGVLFAFMLRKGVLSFAVELALSKLTFVSDAIHSEFAVSRFLALLELTVVETLVEVEGLAATTMILVVFPLTIVHGAFAVD